MKMKIELGPHFIKFTQRIARRDWRMLLFYVFEKRIEKRIYMEHEQRKNKRITKFSKNNNIKFVLGDMTYEN